MAGDASDIRKPRVLIATGTNQCAAGGRVMVDWLRNLPAYGILAHVAFPGGGELEEIFITKGIPWTCVDLSWPKRFWPVGFWARALKLARYVKRHKIQLIHCNGCNDYRLGQLAGKWAGVPVLCHVHWPRSAEYCKWMFGRGREPALTFCVSETLRIQQVADMEGVVPAERVVTLHNCVDTGRFRPLGQQTSEEVRKEWDVPLDAFVIGMPAVIQPRKQQDVLVEVLKGLVDERINGYAVLAGAVGDETYKQLLDDKIRELGLAERVRQIGFVEEMSRFYAGCNVTVSFSTSETFGMSAAESLACGVPLVYFDLPVLQEVVGDGGLDASMNDTNGAVAACKQLRSDSQMYKRVAQAGRERVERKYSPSESARSLVGFYRAVLQREEVRR